MDSFENLNLIEPLRKALAAQSYTQPTPIQARAIPPLLRGEDVLGCAQTGTGKTAAFSLPVLQHLAKAPGSRRLRALILTPTRELAAQIGESLDAYGTNLRTRHYVIFGGVNERPQISALKRGIDILVATPGRLLDLQGRGYVDLSGVEFFVLDEADRMLDMGFVHDVKKLLAVLPKERQNLLFSATMPKTIVSLASSFLKNPVHVEVTPQSTTVERIAQSVMFVDRPDKRRLLVSLLREADAFRAIVFTRTKHGANRLVTQLSRAQIEAAAIHGNKTQNARTRALEGFRTGKIPVLVATDIASRGIDVDDVTHVFNYDLPNEPEVYVHRIGRTARAGREGIAVSFCDASETEYLVDIERTIGQAVPRVVDHEFHLESAIPSPTRKPSAKNQRGKPGSRGPARRSENAPRRERSRSASGSSRGTQTSKPNRDGGDKRASRGKPSGQRDRRPANGTSDGAGRSTNRARPGRRNAPGESSGTTTAKARETGSRSTSDHKQDGESRGPRSRRSQPRGQTRRRRTDPSAN